MILLLHKWEVVQKFVIEVSGKENVTVAQSLPAAICQAKAKIFNAIFVDGTEFTAAIPALAECGTVIVVAPREGDVNESIAKKDGADMIMYLSHPLEKNAAMVRNIANRVPATKARKRRTVRRRSKHTVGGVGLSQTQLDVLLLTMEGWTTKQMSGKLGKSQGYVEEIKAVLFRKVGINGAGPGNKTVRLARWGWENLGGEA